MIFKISWFGKSLLAMAGFVPYSLAANVLGRHYGISPDAMIYYWQWGTILGMSVWFGAAGRYTVMAPSWPLAIIFTLGVTGGAMANIMLAQAVVEYKNSGLPVAITGSNGIVAAYLGMILAVVLPLYFEQFKFDWRDALSLMLITAGIWVASVR